MKMPRILVLATSRRTHGGISSVVAAHESSDEWRAYGCRWVATHRSGSALTKLWYFVRGMMEFLFLLPWAEAVHIHIGEVPSARRKSLFMRLAKLTGKRNVVHFHAFDTVSTIEGPRASVYKALFDDADCVVVLSKMWKDKVNAVFDLGDKVTVLYNPCPTVDSAAGVGGDCAKRNVILSAGVVCERKGYGDLIRAFAAIAPRYKDWRVVFAGSGEIDRAKAIARECGIEDQVEFAGWVSGEAKDRIFRETSVFCLPSYAEGFPMAVLDAWAYGLPVVTTPVGGLPDIVSDGVDVLLFQPGDVDRLAVQLERLIADERLRSTIAEASRRFASETFDVGTVGRHLGEIYSAVLHSAVD